MRALDTAGQGTGVASAMLSAVEMANEVDCELAGDDAYLQPYEGGTNIVGILPGSGALAGEYVLVGAHYDHLGELVYDKPFGRHNLAFHLFYAFRCFHIYILSLRPQN